MPPNSNQNDTQKQYITIKSLMVKVLWLVFFIGIVIGGLTFVYHNKKLSSVSDEKDAALVSPSQEIVRKSKSQLDIMFPKFNDGVAWKEFVNFQDDSLILEVTKEGIHKSFLITGLLSKATFLKVSCEEYNTVVSKFRTYQDYFLKDGNAVYANEVEKINIVAPMVDGPSRSVSSKLIVENGKLRFVSIWNSFMGIASTGDTDVEMCPRDMEFYVFVSDVIDLHTLMSVYSLRVGR